MNHTARETPHKLSNTTKLSSMLIFSAERNPSCKNLGFTMFHCLDQPSQPSGSFRGWNRKTLYKPFRLNTIPRAQRRLLGGTNLPTTTLGRGPDLGHHLQEDLIALPAAAGYQRSTNVYKYHRCYWHSRIATPA